MKKAVFLGDSITMGYGLADPAARFPTVFCALAGMTEVNYGITGTLVARSGLSASDGTAFIDRAPAMEDGDLIVVFGGTNDYFWSGTDLGSPDSDDPTRFCGAARLLCRQLTEKYHGKPIVFLLPYRMRGVGNFAGGHDPRDSSFHPSYEPNLFGRTLADYCGILRDAAKEAGFLLLDLQEDPEIDVSRSDADYEAFTLDGCHPNEAGHRKIAEKLLRLSRDNGIL